MCGIAGVYYFNDSADNNKTEYYLKTLLKSISHRGPDDQGNVGAYCVPAEKGYYVPANANAQQKCAKGSYNDEAGKTFEVLHQLRQQGKKASNIPNFSLSDFVAPQSDFAHTDWDRFI